MATLQGWRQIRSAVEAGSFKGADVLYVPHKSVTLRGVITALSAEPNEAFFSVEGGVESFPVPLSKLYIKTE